MARPPGRWPIQAVFWLEWVVHRRRSSFTTAKRMFEVGLERVRVGFDLCMYGYVVMPDHVHLLLSEPRARNACRRHQVAQTRRVAAAHWRGRALLAKAILRLQCPQRSAVCRDSEIHTVAIRSCEGCVSIMRSWQWSSFVHYATGQEGVIEIESEWTARKRQLAPKAIRIR